MEGKRGVFSKHFSRQINHLHFFDGLSGWEKSFLSIGFGYGFVSSVLFATLIALIIFGVFHRRRQRILGQKLFQSAPRLLSRLRVCSPQQKTTAEHSPKGCAFKEKLPRATIALHYVEVLRPAAVLYLTSVSIYGAFQLRLAADIRREQLRVLRCVADDANPHGDGRQTGAGRASTAQTFIKIRPI